MNERQPIATAPKDETWVILLGEENGEPYGCVAFWSEEYNDWYDSEAASRSVTAFGWQPTHWLPLPPL